MLDAGPGYGLVNQDGDCCACAGVWDINGHRGHCWALITEDIGRNFFMFHKAVLEFLDNTGLPRLEMDVLVGFKEGERWAQMLGFKLEGLMHGYNPDGADSYLYARIK